MATPNRNFDDDVDDILFSPEFKSKDRILNESASKTRLSNRQVKNILGDPIPLNYNNNKQKNNNKNIKKSNNIKTIPIRITSINDLELKRLAIEKKFASTGFKQYSTTNINTNNNTLTSIDNNNKSIISNHIPFQSTPIRATPIDIISTPNTSYSYSNSHSYPHTNQTQTKTNINEHDNINIQLIEIKKNLNILNQKFSLLKSIYYIFIICILLILNLLVMIFL